MNRRNTLRLLVALGAAGRPLAAAAQPANKVWRIGYLGPPEDTTPHLVKAFRDGLREHGYVEGRNIVVEYRGTADSKAPVSSDTLLARARELVAWNPDVIAASIDPPILAARRATDTIPIVMMNVSDPVELGLVSSLAHPGGNLTGLTRLSPDLIGKNLQFLVEAVPGVKRVAMMVDPSAALTPLITRTVQQAAQSRGVSLQVVELRSPSDLDSAFAEIKRSQAEALLVPFSGRVFVQRVRIAELALAQRLPTMFTTTENVEAGGLLAYSPSSAENYRRVGAFIDKILRGTKPGDIPVEQPTTFELAVNLKTAKSIGLVIPNTLLLRADRVIE